MAIRNERICVPGEYLFNVDEGYTPGNGVYSIHGRIHSGLAGVVSTSKVSLLMIFQIIGDFRTRRVATSSRFAAGSTKRSMFCRKTVQL